MAKMRIHEFAKELGVASKDIIVCLEEFGETAKSAQSSIEDDLQLKVKNRLQGTAKQSEPIYRKQCGNQNKNSY